jgi:hypothetical protein
MKLRSETLDYVRYLLEITIIFCSVFILINFELIRLGEPPPYYLDQRTAARIEYIFARLEYVSYFINELMNSGAKIPEGEYAISDLVGIIKNLYSDTDSCVISGGTETFVNFLNKTPKNTDLFEMLSPRVIKTLNDYFGQYRQDFMQNGDLYIEKCFVEQSPISKDYICLGFEMTEMPKHSGKHGNIINVYPKILAAIRGGYYFSDINGTAYDGGNTIVIMLKTTGTVLGY